MTKYSDKQIDDTVELIASTLREEGYPMHVPILIGMIDQLRADASQQDKPLLTRWGELCRDIPHEEGCPRQPPLGADNIRCQCSTGDKLAPIHNELVSIIVENSKSSSLH